MGTLSPPFSGRHRVVSRHGQGAPSEQTPPPQRGGGDREMTPPVFSVSKDANELPHSPPPHRPSVRSSGPRVVKSIASSSRRLHRIAAAARPPPPRAAPRTANPNGSSRQQTRCLVNMSQRRRSRIGAGKKGSEARPSATTTTSRTPLPTGAMAPVRSAANVRGRAMPSDRGKRAERGVGEGRGSHRRGAAACTPCRYRARWQGGPGGGAGKTGGRASKLSAADVAAAASTAAPRRQPLRRWPWRRRRGDGGGGRAAATGALAADVGGGWSQRAKQAPRPSPDGCRMHGRGALGMGGSAVTIEGGGQERWSRPWGGERGASRAE